MEVHTFFALLGLAAAAQGQVSQDSAGGVVSMAFERRSSPSHTLEKRSSTVESNSGTWRFAGSDMNVNITIGTPPQIVELTLDTGSSDLVIMASSGGYTDWCLQTGYCSVTTTYNANSSSTYEYLNSDFIIAYGDGSTNGSGDWVTDTVMFNGIPIKQQQFGLAYNKIDEMEFGTFGLSYPYGEEDSGQPLYNNLPFSLVANDAIDLALFTLWQNDEDSGLGKILFGGVDEAKYSGALTTVPIPNAVNAKHPRSFSINIDGFGLTANGSTTSNSTAPVLTLVDLGTWYTGLPIDWVLPILDKLDATYFKDNGSVNVDCSLRNQDYTFDFTFGNLTIEAPIRDFVTPLSGDVCNLNLIPSDNDIGQVINGANFLLSTVAVFDMSNNEISFAQRDFSATGEKVVAVPKGGVKALAGSGFATGSSSTGASETEMKMEATTASSTPTGKSDTSLLGGFEALLRLLVTSHLS